MTYMNIEDDFENLKKLVGSNVRIHRLKKALSQKQLSELSGLDANYIGSVERERNISLKNLYYFNKLRSLYKLAFFEKPIEIYKMQYFLNISNTSLNQLKIDIKNDFLHRAGGVIQAIQTSTTAKSKRKQLR